jgi:hypothetical protein
MTVRQQQSGISSAGKRMYFNTLPLVGVMDCQ